MQYAVINVVWGEAYSKFFIEHSLPTFLASGNLPFLAHETKCLYRLYTTPADHRAMQSSAAFQTLQQIMEVQVAYIAEISEYYRTASAQYRSAVNELKEAGTVVCLVSPDLLLAAGGFEYAVNLIKRGTKAVLMCVLRLSMERSARTLQSQSVFTPREMADLAIRCPHPQRLQAQWRKDSVFYWPSHIHWPVGSAGFITHPFHTHPFMVVLDKNSVMPGGTIDGDFVSRVVRPEDIALITDSDSMCMMEVSPDAHHSNGPFKQEEPLGYVANWLLRNTNELQRSHFRETVRFHSGDLGPERHKWQPVELEARRIVKLILGRSRP